jgi:hypothetical protein
MQFDAEYQPISLRDEFKFEIEQILSGNIQKSRVRKLELSPLSCPKYLIILKVICSLPSEDEGYNFKGLNSRRFSTA